MTQKIRNAIAWGTTTPELDDDTLREFLLLPEFITLLFCAIRVLTVLEMEDRKVYELTEYDNGIKYGYSMALREVKGILKS